MAGRRLFEALLEGVIAEAAKRGEVDLSPVSGGSTTARAHHGVAGIHLGEDVVTVLEKAAAEEEKAWSKGAVLKDRLFGMPKPISNGRSGDTSGADVKSG